MTSIYSPKYVDRHLNALKQFESGNIIFTFPASPVKCPGAPQKICYITEDFLRKANKRKQAHIMYNSALPTIFGCKYFADALWKVVDKRDIEVNLKTNLVEVQGDKNTAIFANVDNPNEKKIVQVRLVLNFFLLFLEGFICQRNHLLIPNLSVKFWIRKWISLLLCTLMNSFSFLVLDFARCASTNCPTSIARLKRSDQWSWFCWC